VEFNDRFLQLHDKRNTNKMLSSPFSVEIDATPTDLQMEFFRFSERLEGKGKIMLSQTYFYSKYIPLLK
jgi:hypothetical protein